MAITQDSSAPLVVVVGATGNQGGSVVKALVGSDKAYRVRALTRDPSKPAAQAMAALGVEVVQANLVVENRTGLVTNFFEHLDAARELAEGKLFIDAAKAAGARGIVWSGYASPTKVSNGKYPNIVHWESKAAVTQYGRESGVPFVDVQCGSYGSNFVQPPFAPVKEEGNVYVLKWPVGKETPVAFIDVGSSDYGLFVRHVLEMERFPDGEEFVANAEVITVTEMAEQWSKGTGKSITLKPISVEAFKQGLEPLKLPPLLMALFPEFGLPSGPIPPGVGPLRKWADFVKDEDWSKILA
ncbi:NAD(P)-binding protein [Roridomyces roridus]|uniref:NAD(P)-binding protein n=1 Tax=Roridomyces roridus TaxID=1738132 RepID=A0AAD7BZX6_9AGAR|nr:NAD(P)-binding protein [Roridomyces roridus]